MTKPKNFSRRRRLHPSLIKGKRGRQHIRYRNVRGKFTKFRRNQMLSVWVYDTKGRQVRQLMAESRLGSPIGVMDLFTNIERPEQYVPSMPKRAKGKWQPVDRVMGRLLRRDKEAAQLFDLEMPFFVYPRRARFAREIKRRVRSSEGGLEDAVQYVFAEKPLPLTTKVRRMWLNALILWRGSKGRDFLAKRNFNLFFSKPFKIKNLFTSRVMFKLENELESVLLSQVKGRETTAEVVAIQGISV